MVTDYTTVIGVDQLVENLDNPDWIILDCRFDLSSPGIGREQYLAGHIPGAQYVHLNEDLSSPITAVSGRHPLPEPEALAGTFSRLGIDPSIQVVAYDADGGGFAARLWWCLQYAGHAAVAVLDGGYPAWLRAGLEHESANEVAPTRQFQLQPRMELRIDTDAILSQLGDSSKILLDSRAAERYRGEEEPIDALPGHIPGAINRHWQDNLKPDGTWKDPGSLRREFEIILDQRSPGQLAAYCGSGVTACQNILSMAYAGFEGMKLYPGSWSEWIRDPARPIVSPGRLNPIEPSHSG